MKWTVTIELDRIKITTNDRSNQKIWCEFCQKESEFLNQSEASEMVRAMREQDMTINKEKLHFYQQDNSNTLVCLNSIITGSDPN